MTPVTVSVVERPGREPKFRWIELSDGRRFQVRYTGASVPCPGRKAGSLARIWSVEIDWKGRPVHRFIVKDDDEYFVVRSGEDS